MFNPLNYVYNAKIIGEEKNDVFLQIQERNINQILRFPRALLPKESQTSEEFQIKILPAQMQNKSEEEILKNLLKELID